MKKWLSENAVGLFVTVVAVPSLIYFGKTANSLETELQWIKKSQESLTENLDKELEEAKQRNKSLKAAVVGLLKFVNDPSPENEEEILRQLLLAELEVDPKDLDPVRMPWLKFGGGLSGEALGIIGSLPEESKLDEEKIAEIREEVRQLKQEMGLEES